MSGRLWRQLAEGRLGLVAPSASDRGDDGQRCDHYEQPEQHAGRQADTAEGSETSSTTPRPMARKTMIKRDDQQDAADAREDAGGGGGNEQSHGAQREQLASAGRRLPEALDGALEVAGAAFGQRQRCVGHAPDLHPLLRACGCDGALEVPACGLGVESLGGTRAEDRHRGSLVFGLGFGAPRRSAARAPGWPRGHRAAPCVLGVVWEPWAAHSMAWVQRDAGAPQI